MNFLSLLWLLSSIISVHALSSSLGNRISISERQSNGKTNQSLVTWDEHSFMIRGERLFLFSGEFHPFRLPVPGLWLDVFQKIKAMGFNGVSFYTYWGLQEGIQGKIVTDGIWSLNSFFEAAAEAGIYLIARPGPYINAETAAGGMAGWSLRINATLRSDAIEYTDSIKLYMATLGKEIAEAQITNGGPVILVQPENEYTSWPDVDMDQFPIQLNREYMAFVEQRLLDAGIDVPLIFNDNYGMGYFAPGTGLGSVDIYGIDAYPMRYDCAHPHIWPNVRFPRDWQIMHEQQSPSTPFAIPEFQGGSGTGWGPDSVPGSACNALVNEESVRVLFKNNYSFGVKLLNIYMTYGGTNWGNLAYEGGDSSYDYGAAISEDRHVWREKYSEEKLEANFLKVSPAYLTAIPGNASNGTYTSTKDLTTTPVLGTDYPTNFYVVRQANWTSLAHTPYTITFPMASGNLTIPQLGGQLTLNGRDSKIHVTDYDVGGINMIYCTADIMTWAKSESGKRVLVMYGGVGETHEFAFNHAHGKPVISKDTNVKIEGKDSLWIVQWQVREEQQIVHIPNCDLEIRMIWRNDAYNYWVLELPAEEPIAQYSSPSKSHVIVNGGYLLRTADIDGTELRLTGDINATTDFEIIHEPTGQVSSITFNSAEVSISRNSEDKLCCSVPFQAPSISLPDFSKTTWKYINSLPEIKSSYDDSQWTSCDHETTTNDQLGLQTPTSLYASDYGYHTGSLLYRGHFVANGNEDHLFVNVSGGSGFGHSVWLNQTYLGHWAGNVANSTYFYSFPIDDKLESGSEYVITVLIDHMGQTEEAPGLDSIKFPFGILDYRLSGHEQSDVTWKMTGNLGGEDYRDHVRGPRNEGAMFAERQGYHLPAPPSSSWEISSPLEGLQEASVRFYSTSFELDVPEGYDVPMSFVFNSGKYSGKDCRVQLFANGYQFGKYVNNLGPQTSYPVPEGILNYSGTNWIGLTLWAQEADGAKMDSLELVPQMPVWSGYKKPALSPQPAWTKREGAY